MKKIQCHANNNQKDSRSYTNMRQNKLEDKKRQKRIFYNDKRAMQLPLRIHTDKKREINNLTIFRNFNTLLIMDKTSKQMNKETEELQDSKSARHDVDIYRRSPPNCKAHILLKHIGNILKDRPYISSLNKPWQV